MKPVFGQNWVLSAGSSFPAPEENSLGIRMSHPASGSPREEKDLSEVKAVPKSKSVSDLGPTQGRRGHFICHPAKALCQHTLLVLACGAFLQLFLPFTFMWTMVLMESFSQLPANPFDLSSMGRVTQSATSVLCTFVITSTGVPLGCQELSCHCCCL